MALCTGCLSPAQLEAVREFGSATAAVAQLSSAELVQMRSGTIAMKLQQALDSRGPASGEEIRALASEARAPAAAVRVLR